MPVNLNVSSTEPSIHTARDCVGNREKRARLVAFLVSGWSGSARRRRGVDAWGGQWGWIGRIRGQADIVPRVRERVAVGYFGERGRPPADRGDPLPLSRSLCGCAFTRFSPRLECPPRDRVSHRTSSVIAPRNGIRFRYGSSNSQYVRYGSSNSQYVRYGQYHRESVLVRFRRSGYRVMLNPPRQVPSD